MWDSGLIRRGWRTGNRDRRVSERRAMVKPSKDGVDVGLLVKDFSTNFHFYIDVSGLTLIETVPVRLGAMHPLRFGNRDFKPIEPKKSPPQKGPAGLETQLGFQCNTFPPRTLRRSALALRKIRWESFQKRDSRGCGSPSEGS